MTAKKDPKDWLKKGPAPKFPGGTVLKTYRLPADRKLFAAADRAIRKLLKELQNKS